MHGVHAEQHGNPQAAVGGVDGRVIERVRQFQPGLAAGQLAAGLGVAPRQDRAQPVLAHLVRGNAGDVGLDDLAYLVFVRHFGQQAFHALFQRRIVRERPLHLGPCVRVHYGRVHPIGRCGLDVRAAGAGHGESADQRSCRRESPFDRHPSITKDKLHGDSPQLCAMA